MTFLNLLGVSDVLAAPATAAQNGGLASMLPMIVIFSLGAYLLMIRPQNRRAKAHRKLMNGLAKGDEVVTVGGIIGKIAKITDEFITISIAENTDISIQKSAVANVLPKGTMKSLEAN